MPIPNPEDETFIDPHEPCDDPTPYGRALDESDVSDFCKLCSAFQAGSCIGK